MVYSALIYPYILYGILIWGNSKNPSINRLQSKQNKIINLMNFSQDQSQFNPILFKRVSLLKIQDICALQTCLFTYDFINNKLPAIFKDFLRPKLREGNDVITRSNENNFYIEFTYTKYAKMCLKTAAASSWSKIPDIIKTSRTRNKFKRSLIKHMILSY